MYNLKVETSKITYDLTFKSVLNVICMESCTGKTSLCNTLENRLYKSISHNFKEVVVSTRLADAMYAESGTLLVYDMDSIHLDVMQSIIRNSRDDIVYCFLGRKYLSMLPIAVKNTYKFVTKNHVTRNVPVCTRPLVNYSPFNRVLVEDSKSGFEFFSKIFSNVETSNGNSNIIPYLRSKQLVIFDALGFGAHIEEFLDRRDLYSCPFVGYGSFETFLLKELFGCDTIPEAFNLEESALKKLQEFNTDYSKTKGCTGDACSSCSLHCKQSAFDLFSKSEYQGMLNMEETEDTIKKFMKKYNIEKSVDEVKSLLPDCDLPVELLEISIKSMANL